MFMEGVVADLHDAVTSGQRIRSLEALRDYLSARLQATVDERSVAPIAKMLADVMRELADIKPAEEASPIDDLASKRATRRKKAQASKRAGGANKRGRGSGQARGNGGPAS